MLSKEMKRKLEANIWKFYMYRVLSSLIFSIPIFILFYQENGLSMTQIMILQSIYTVIIMFAVVPAGIAADYLGRKIVLIIEAAFYFAGYLTYALSYGFWGFVLAEILIALSSGLWMASGTAFFYDNLKELGREASFKKKFGNVIGINYAMYAIASLAGGYIAAYGFRMNFFLSAIILVPAFFMVFSFTDTKIYKHGDTHYLAHLKDAANFAAKHARVRMLIVYSAIFMAVSFSIYILYQPYLSSISIPIIYFGVIYAIMNFFTAGGSKIADKIESLFGEKYMLFVLLIIAAGCTFGMSKEIAVFGAVFPVLMYMNSGISEPIIADYMNKHIESHHRATVLSLSTLVSEGVSTVAAPFFGWIVDAWSLSTAFTAAAIILCFNLIILAIAVKWAKR